ncbi:putative tricarboxylic transport membrane protein [Caldalkalibacillus uzonensis]|uniref:Tricarboxylic transport membrane protein n=1 Tax=Caldalkalibacillus uzonensis TaxID=353224 RepID=A0ABU0CT45_9BACI|nr:tripartite tricarboxylate transporter permease [Caldalkalibacillus uzonensis]MDQ0338207.1 putative tricarboxylic transport membrane protein [Caldalkalibacillus uzonensis]
MLEYLLLGLQIVFEPLHLFMILLGVVIGIMFGMVPGLSGVTAVSLLIPFTYAMDPISGFLVMVGIYAASVYGGGISAILFNTPGDAPAAVTTLDGYPLTQKGEAFRALGMAAFASLVGGLFSAVVLTLLAPQAAKVALSFGAPEYFALGMLALFVVASIDSENQIKAFISVLIGLFIATIGLDTVSGVSRYTFNISFLQAGVDFIPVIIGLFAVSEVLSRFHQRYFNVKYDFTETNQKRFALPEKRDISKVKWTLARSSVLGTIIGILPGAGATIASFLGYGSALRASKDKQSFGKGNIEGVAAPEAANNAAVGGALIPLLTLGIPGGAVTAVILSAFLIHGLRPGPLLFQYNPDIAYSIFIGLFLANIFMAILVLLSIRYIIRILNVRYEYLGVLILILSVVGTFAINNRLGDVWIMFVCGVVGFFLKKYKFSLASIILGLVLGDIIENGLRQGLMMTGGNFFAFFTRPVSGTILVLTILVLFAPVLKKILENRVLGSQQNISKDT